MCRGYRSQDKGFLLQGALQHVLVPQGRGRGVLCVDVGRRGGRKLRTYAHAQGIMHAHVRTCLHAYHTCVNERDGDKHTRPQSFSHARTRSLTRARTCRYLSASLGSRHIILGAIRIRKCEIRSLGVDMCSCDVGCQTSCVLDLRVCVCVLVCVYVYMHA